MAKRSAKRSRATLTPLPSLIGQQPPQAQMLNRHTMRGEWRDPMDTTPSASRTARTIAGHRVFCPLRWCIRRHGERSTFTAEHVAAADKLRIAFDGARLGYSGLKDWRPVTAINYRPSTGPASPALRQLRARKTFDSAWSLFDDPTRAVLVGVVLSNLSLARCAAITGRSAHLSKQLLADALDRLVLHFDIERDMAAGRVAA
jgi:hypothetical protein